MRFFILLLILFPVMGHAGLDEVVLSTADKKCAIRYLSSKSMKNWSVQTKADCPDGWVHGYHQVEIIDGRKEKTETLKGFFMDGYWLGLLPAKAHVLNRLTPSENVQSLTFLAHRDEGQDIDYIVQLRATKNESGSYAEFQGCPIFRLLVVNKQRDLFLNEAFQEQITKEAFLIAKKLCAKLETIAVFGATKSDALASDMFFQMQIDGQTKEKTIVPIQTDFDDSDINTPIELRQESSEVLLSVEPSENDLKIDYSDHLANSSKTPTKTEKKALPITSLNHLDVQSRIMEKPVKGRVVVHIDTIDLDGTAKTDLPKVIELKHHPKLKIGWAIVQGMFYQNQMQVSDIKFCQQEWCKDVS
jgi:hypothetical protein